jgi:dimethylaniline monooxygenase (N-oxide forming)
VTSICKDDIKNDTIPWTVKVETIDGQNETFKFDLVVIASGLYSEPNIPTFRGQNKFNGSIVHPSIIKSSEQVADKRVVVIGGGKCATDMAVFAGHFARSCHLVFRRAHWMTPRKILRGRVSVRFLCARVSSTLFTPFPSAPHTALFRFLHRTFPGFFKRILNVISADIIATLGPDLFHDKIFIPRHLFQNEENISTIPDDFVSLKKAGRITGKLASVDEIIDGTTIRLVSGEELQADLIICATGFVSRFPFFSEEHAQIMGFSTSPNLATSNGDTKTNLYRRILPVGIPNIAFIGFGGSVYHWMVAEVASHWISDYFLKRLKLPSVNEMYEEIKTTRSFLQDIFHGVDFDFKYYSIGPIEMYLKDMGLTLHRTNNWISEYFGIYRPARFKGLHEERRIKSEKGIPPSHWYFSFEHTVLFIVFLTIIFFIF